MFAPIASLINRTLLLDPKSKERLLALSGKHIKIAVRPLNTFSIELSFTPEALHLSLPTSPTFDAIIEGSVPAFITVAMTKDPHQAAKLGLDFQGDMAVVQLVQALLIDLDIDWEELLSRYTSDIFAHGIGQLYGKAKRYQKALVSSLTHNVRDYLQEEAKMIPSPKEAEAFYQDIEVLRDRVDRGLARISRMENKIWEQDTST